MAISSEERKLLQLTDKLISEAKTAKERVGLHAKWEEYRRVREGSGLWKGSRPPHIEANLPGNYLDRKIAALTESKPEVMVTSRRKDYSAPAKILNDTVRAMWDHLNLQQKQKTAADNAGTVGTVGYLVEWDPDALYGRGDMVLKVIPPEAIGLDPAVTAVEDLAEAEYVWWEDWPSLEWLTEKFPGRGGLVQPEVGVSSYPSSLSTSRRRVSGPHRMMSRDKGSSVIPRARLRTFWRRDLSKDATGEYLYPGGRRILRAGDIILSDGPNPYWDGTCPLDLWAWTTRSGTPWGDGDIKAIRKLGEAFNRLADLLMRNAILNNNVWIVGDFDALEAKEWNKLDNLEALVVKKRFGRDLRRDPPPNMPPYYFQMLSFIPSIMETMVGLKDIAPGGRPPGAPSLGALEAYQQASQSLIRSINFNLETTMRRVGQKMISRILQFYTSDRVFDIVGPSGEFMQYVFERSKLLKTTEGRQILVTNQAEHRDFLAEFSYLVVPNSGLASNRIQRALIMQQLAQAGLVDGLSVLKTLGPELVPDADAAYQRAKAEQAQNAQMGLQPSNRRVRSNRSGTQLGMGA